MRIGKVRMYTVLWIILLDFIACSICLYKGLPYDILKKENIREADLYTEVTLNGYSYFNSILTADSDDANITIENGKEIRSFFIEIGEMNFIEGDNEIQVYYTKKDENFSEEYSMKQILKSGKNIIIVPYDLRYDKIRLDLGNKKGEFVEITNFSISNKFEDIRRLFTVWIFSTLSMFVFIYLLLWIKERKEIIRKKDEIIYNKLFGSIISLFNELKKYINENKELILGITIIGLITFGAQIWNYTLSIDEENNLMNSKEYLVYFSSGRFFLALLIKYFSLSPYFNSFVASLLMCISAFLLSMLLSKVSNEIGEKCTKYSILIFSGLYISMPYVIGETLNFAMQGAFIALGYCLIVCAIYLLNRKRDNNKRMNVLWSLIFSVISFGIYQSFVIVYIFIVAFLILFKVKAIKNKGDIYNIIKYLLKYIAAFFVSIILYEIVNYLCGKYIISSNGYLENSFVGWNRHMPNDWVWKNVWTNWYKVITGQYYNMTGGMIVKISIIFYMIYSFISIIYANKWNRIFLMILYPSMIILPFLIPLSLGSFIMLGRSLNAFPILIGLIWFMILNEVSEFKIVFQVLKIISCILLIFQIKAYNEFVYVDQLRYRLDIELADSVMEEVYKIENFSDKSLIFIGTYDFKNPNNLYLVSGCESFFAFQNGDNYRILNFLYLSGYHVNYPTQEQYNDAYEAAKDMQAWPKGGSIVDKGAYIVVKLGD